MKFLKPSLEDGSCDETSCNYRSRIIAPDGAKLFVPVIVSVEFNSHCWFYHFEGLNLRQAYFDQWEDATLPNYL